MINRKVIIIFLITGFVFSFILGIFGGNPFYVILWRAVVAGAFFALLLSAALFLIFKMAPPGTGSGEGKAEEKKREEKSDSEGKVDIVIDDDIDPEKLYDGPVSDSSDGGFIEEIHEDVAEGSALSEDGGLGDITEIMGKGEVRDEAGRSAHKEEADDFSFSGSEKTAEGFENTDSASLVDAVRTMIKKEE